MDLAAAFTLAGVLALTWKVVSTLKSATNRRWGDVLTQVVTWLGCLVVLILAAEAELVEAVKLNENGATLGSIDFASKLYLALFVGSGASVAYDVKKAVDRSDSAVEPKLLPPSS